MQQTHIFMSTLMIRRVLISPVLGHRSTSNFLPRLEQLQSNQEPIQQWRNNGAIEKTRPDASNIGIYLFLALPFSILGVAI